MKKILAILSGVAMLLSACTPNNNEPKKPEFPEKQTLAVVAGESYDFTFKSDYPWSLTLPAESQPYATLTYDGYTDTQFYGEAGEHSLSINIKSGVGSYAKDVVFMVDLTIDEYTESIVECTLPRLEKVINVTGAPNAGSEATVKTTLTKGGHPKDSPFSSAPHTYTVLHINGYDASGAEFYVQHDFDEAYNYEVYCKNGKGEIVNVTNDENTWLELVKFGSNGEKHRLYMNHTKSSAKRTYKVGFEAYVNIEDENKDAVISIYYLYNPDAETVTQTSLGLANPDLAAEKGVKLEGEGTAYTLTIPTSDILTENYAAAALKYEGYSEIYATIPNENLQFVYDSATKTSYVSLREGKTLDGLVRESTWEISAVGDNGVTSYTITAIYEWAPEAEPEDVVE